MSNQNLPTATSGPQSIKVFWAKWSPANMVGWAVGGAVVWAIAKVPLIMLLATVVTFGAGWAIIFGGVMGIAFGTAQRFVLLREGIPLYRWVTVTWGGGAIGGLASAIIFWAVSLSGHGFLDLVGNWAIPFMAIAGLVTGIAIGLLQRLTLRTPNHQIDFWILFNALGWTCACTLSEVLAEVLLHTPADANKLLTANFLGSGASSGPIQLPLWTFPFSLGTIDLIPLITIAALCGLVGGVITGIPLVRMLQNQKSEI